VWCEIWALALREEHTLREFENRLLRKIFEPKKEVVTGEWRKLCNEELDSSYSLLIIVRVMKQRGMRWGEHVAHMGEIKKCIQNVGWKT
jgi:hypothetical protein